MMEKQSRISRVYAVCFSPCGNAKKIVTAMAEYAAAQLSVEMESIDFTLPEMRAGTYSFSKGDLVFFGTPVYAGRVPNKIMPFIQQAFAGNGAYGVPVVSFGNRSFDNALSELALLLKENAFQIAGAAAVVSEHSFSSMLAPGRPSEDDIKEIQEFTRKVLDKVVSAENNGALAPFSIPGENPPTTYYTPLGVDGKPAKFLKAVPVVDTAVCQNCGTCSRVCPMGSIDEKQPEITRGICIKCHACIHICPKQARQFTDEAFLSHKAMLEKNYQRRAESRFYL